MAKKSNVRRRKPKNGPENNGAKHTPSDGAPTVTSTLSSTVWWKRAAVAVAMLAVIILFVFNGDINHTTPVSEEASDKQSRRRSQSHADHNRRDTSMMDGSDYQVLQVLTHDITAFTQGLTYYQGYLYETTGYHGQSQVRRMDPNTGQVLEAKNVDEKYFGEGVAHFIDKNDEACLIQLTWEEKTGFIYRISDLEILKTFSYETTNGQGWGITYDETKQEFIVSDGSAWLLFWDRDTLQEKRRVQVHADEARARSCKDDSNQSFK